jgi:hypothetical protein
MPESDPSWFFSSLAQSTAAVVGFVGAFLIFRIQDSTTAWARKCADLETLQRRWIPAHIVVDGQEDEWYTELGAEPHAPRDSFVDRAVERDRDEARRELRPLLDEKHSAQFPTELPIITALLGVLFIAGTMAPLLFLGAPENEQQALWVVLVSGLLACSAVFMVRRAHGGFTDFKNATVLPVVVGEWEQQLLNEEGWRRQAEEYQREREQLRREESRRVDEEAEERVEQEREEEVREDAERRREEEREAQRREEAEAEARELGEEGEPLTP